MQLPAIGYGLRYQYGIFDQEIWNGIQIERPDCWLLNPNPWEFRRDGLSRHVAFRGSIPPSEDPMHHFLALENYEEVRSIAYDYPIIGFPAQDRSFSVVTMRLWSTKESPRNFALQRYNAGELGQAGENTSLTDVLYPNDHHAAGKRIRLKQEFLLVSASLQDIVERHFSRGGGLDTFADKVRIQINDTHPALVIPELIRLLMIKGASLDHAFAITKTSASYTNHTILKEALEEWNEERMMDLLPRQYRMIQHINMQFCKEVRASFGENTEKAQAMSIIGEGQIKMAHLLLYGTHKINGVAKLHGTILKEEVFNDFFQLYPDKFCHVTNGVSHRKWLLQANPLLADFITERIGSSWIHDFSQIIELKRFAKCPKAKSAFAAIKKKNKQRLIQWLREKSPIRDGKGAVIGTIDPLGEEALFDIQVKRIHEYKRQMLNLLHAARLYLDIKKERKSPPIKRMILIAGKAAPGYQLAKEIIHFARILSHKINNDPEVNQHLRLAFIESYNVSKTLFLIPAADLSSQISLVGREASGTGNMKMAMNGALTIGTEDGANEEMRWAVGDEYWPFRFGMNVEEVQAKKTSGYSPSAIYQNNPIIREVLDFMVSDALTDHPAEKQCMEHLRKNLLEGEVESAPDPYYNLQDFSAFYETQKRVEMLYQDQDKWNEYAIMQIASMGFFTSDRSIQEYVDHIWDTKACPIDPDVLQKLQRDISPANKPHGPI